MRIKINYHINKKFILKKRDRLLQKQNDRYIDYNELEIKLKALEEKVTKKDSEIN